MNFEIENKGFSIPLSERCDIHLCQREVLGQEEKEMTEDEMAGWHHRLDGLEFE